MANIYTHAFIIFCTLHSISSSPLVAQEDKSNLRHLVERQGEMLDLLSQQVQAFGKESMQLHKEITLKGRKIKLLQSEVNRIKTKEGRHFHIMAI